MPKGTILAHEPRAGGPQRTASAVLPPGSWLFNNLAIALRSQAYPYAFADIPRTGRYRLLVYSHGTEGASFRVSLGAQQTSEIFGNEPLRWKDGGAFDLRQGPLEVVLSRVVLGRAGGSIFNTMVLTTDRDFQTESLKAYELQPDVALLKEYPLPPRSSAVKFGDVDGDLRSDFFVLDGNYAGSMFAHDGRRLWTYENEQEGVRARSGFEAPGLLWDFDGDGRSEAVHYSLSEGKEWLVVSDGATGSTKHKTLWPTPPMPHEYNNFRLAVAQLSGARPKEILAFTDSGGLITITAYTSDLRQLWQHVEHNRKDHLGHYVYAVDLDKDGLDEVLVSGLALNAAGKVLWNRFDLLDDNHDHCDSLRFGDIDADGKPEILAPVSEIGVMVFRALTGELVWRRPAEHAQQLEMGNFLDGVPGPHIAVNARTYARNGEAGLGGQVVWFDARGKLLSKWPANPINGNPDFVAGDWKGGGSRELFWHRFRLTRDGRALLSFRQDVYHMFDFMGNGSDQAIARGPSSLLVYGYKHFRPRDVKRDTGYRKMIANHTHY